MQWLRRLPLRYKIASIGTSVLIVMMIALGVLSLTVQEMIATQAEQDTAQEITELTGQLYGSLVDMQTGVRGYVITREERFLEPYQLGVVTAPLLIDRLEHLLAHDPQQLMRVQQLRIMVKTYDAERLQRQIDLTETGKYTPQEAFAGKVSMDEIKNVLNEIQQTSKAEANILKRRVANAVRQTQWFALTILAGAAGFSLFLAYAVSASVTRPIQKLAEAADAVAKGGLGLQVAVESADEVGMLARSFNAMSLSLQGQAEENAAQQEELQAQQEELHAQNEELQAQQETLASTMEQLEADRARLERLNHFSRLMVTSPDLQSLCQTLLAELLGAADAQVGSVMLLDERGQVAVAANVGLTEEALQADRAVGFTAQAARSGAPLAVRYPLGALLRPIYHTELPVEHELYVPIRVADQTLAVAALGRTGPAPFSDQEVHWAGLMASQAGAALSNRSAFEQLRELSASLKIEHDRARAQADNLNAVLGTTSEGFWLVDEGGNTLMVNPRFWELTGFPTDSLPTFEEFLQQVGPRQKHSDSVRNLTNQFMRDPDLTGTDIIEFAAPRELVLQRFSAPVYGADGHRIGRLFVLRDVTRETEVDRMKTEFISTVSHELRTPLTSIRGFVDLILDGDAGPVSAEQKEFLELVSRSTVRLSNLINDLLDVEKIENGRIEMRRELIGLTPILEHVVKSFTVAAQEKGLDLRLQMNGPLPLIDGDADRLTQVFTNLVSNAVKYTRTGAITLTSQVRDSHLAVSVADTGIGIARENLQQLFTRFFRVDNEYTREVGGAGLGLAITRAIVKHHRGEVAVESTPGQGSTFTVLLPLPHL